jgi:L-lactate dehydrogenase
MRENSGRNVVIVGAGAVGATFAYALMLDGAAEEIVLVDRNQDLAKGQVLDLNHGRQFTQPVRIRVGTPADYGTADVIVVTAGSAQKPGESRLDLLQRNASIIRSIMGDISDAQSEAVVVIVTNPVDILTQIAVRAAGDERQRIFGSGTVLDSARFRGLIAEHCQVDIHNVHAYIIGEHGDSEVPAWSMTHIAGVPVWDHCADCRRCHGELRNAENREALVQQVRDSAYHIIGYKGATNFAVGLALVRIVRSILRNERSVLTVSTVLAGEYGLRDICLSVPCIVGRNGIERVVEGKLSEEELTGLSRSGKILHQRLAELDQ